MTEKQIMKALECCILGDCQGCLYGDTDQRHCKDDLMQNALDLIKRQKAENEKLISKLDELESEYALYKISAQERIEALIAGQETLQKYIAEKDAEIDMLNQNIEVLAICKKDLPQITMNAIKFEAVKEFAERFLKKIHENHYMLSDKHNSTDKGMFTIGIEQAVKETKKEMVGEEK